MITQCSCWSVVISDRCCRPCVAASLSINPPVQKTSGRFNPARPGLSRLPDWLCGAASSSRRQTCSPAADQRSCPVPTGSIPCERLRPPQNLLQRAAPPPPAAPPVCFINTHIFVLTLKDFILTNLCSDIFVLTLSF